MTSPLIMGACYGLAVFLSYSNNNYQLNKNIMEISNLSELKEVVSFTFERTKVSGADLQLKFVKGYNWAHKKINEMKELKIVEVDKYNYATCVLSKVEIDKIISDLAIL